MKAGLYRKQEKAVSEKSLFGQVLKDEQKLGRKTRVKDHAVGKNGISQASEA